MYSGCIIFIPEHIFQSHTRTDVSPEMDMQNKKKTDVEAHSLFTLARNVSAQDE